MSVKMFSVVFAVLVIFTLFNGDYREVEDCAIITALGIDKEENGILLTAEIINTQSVEGGATATILYGRGNTMVEAIGDLSASTPKNLLFSHVSVIAVGDTLSKKEFLDAESFCLNNPQLTLSMKIIATKSAKQLLCVKPYTLSITAFEIVSLLNATDKSLSFGKYNSFINVERGHLLNSKIMALPYFETINEGGKSLYKLKGLKILKDHHPITVLDSNQSEVYEILQREFKNGNITLFDKSAFIKNCTADLSADLKNNRLYFDYDIILTANQSGITKLETQKLSEDIENTAKQLFKMQNNDILGLGSTLESRYYQIYSQIKNDTANYIKNAEYNIRIKFND